mgnify:CR=1 FL=1
MNDVASDVGPQGEREARVILVRHAKPFGSRSMRLPNGFSKGGSTGPFINMV